MLRSRREPEDVRTDPDCPLGRCDGSGWVVADEANVARPCACRERRLQHAMTGRLRGGIPRRLLAASPDRHPDIDPAILRHVRRFRQDVSTNVRSGRGLWFHGRVGTGKSTLALWVAKAASDAGHSVAIYSVPLLLAEMRETYDRETGDSYIQLFKRLTAVDLLVLDDLGAERQTEWVLEQLYSLVNERWQDEKSIVVTTNVADPYRDVTLETLRSEIAELKRAQSKMDVAELKGIVGRLERVASELSALELTNDADAVTRLRQQIGSRTVSRLIEICDDPLLMLGEDLRTKVPLP